MIRLILLAGAFALVLFSIYGKKTDTIRAIEKLLFLAITVAGLVFLASPHITTTIAHFLGVGRGTDLIVYFLSIAVMYMAISIYIEMKRSAARQATLVQDLALVKLQLASLRESQP